LHAAVRPAYASIVAAQRVTVIDEGRTVELDATVSGDAVAVAPPALAAGLGWELKPEGLCRGAVCVPVRDRAKLVGADGVDLAELARVLARPFAAEAAAGLAVLGTAAGDRQARMTSLEAPDFTLPDLGGALHSLSDHRGKKRLLIAWASW
jgi:hypothetical protein